MKPKKILHIGDVHIFRSKRFDEHRYRQDQLCNFIIDNQIDLVYVGGDVVDSKARLSPEQIKVTQRFFYKISSIVPMIVIPGNHDLDLKREKSLDSLTPILEVLDTKHPIYYLKETGIYNLYDIDWCVWSCIDEENPFEKYPSHKKTTTQIGCFHGPVRECSTDTGFTGFSSSPSIDIFKNCDLAMLADIHKTQFFRNNEIAYCGSLIQTNVSESEERGGIVWELRDDKYEPTFHSIKSDYGFRTYEITDLNTFDTKKIKNIPKHYTLRLLYTGEDTNFSATKFSELQKELKSKYNQSVILQKKFKKSSQQASQQVKTTNSKINFFKEYFKNVDANTYAVLEALDKKIDQIIDATEYQSGEYFIEEVEIHNFLVFGSNNVIDLRSTTGILGILGPNKLGKSSILEAIMFCLFNESPKGDISLAKLVNDQMPAKTEAFVQLHIRANGKRIRIKRALVPEGKKYKVKLEVFEIGNDGSEEPLHEEDRRVTDTTVLKKIIGDKTVFFTTVLYSPKVSTEFVKLRNADRLDAIMKFVGIIVYDQKADICKKIIDSLDLDFQLLKKEFDKLPIAADLEVRKKEVESLAEITEEAIWETSEEIDSLKQTFEVIKNLLTNIQTKKPTHTIESLEQDKKDTEVLIEKNKKLTKDVCKTRDTTLLTWKAKEKTDIGIWKYDKTKELEYVTSIAEITSEIKHLKHSLDSEICPTCNQKRLDIDKDKVTEEIKVLTNKKEELERLKKAEVDNNTALWNLKEDYKTALNSLEVIELKLDNLTNKLSRIEQEIEWYNQNKDSIEQKEILETELSRLQNSIAAYTTSKIKSEQLLLSYNKEIEAIEKGIIEYDSKYIELQEKELELQAHVLYRQAMHRTGIPSLILQTYIPAINLELNHYTNQFGMNLQFVLNEKDLDIVFFYEEQKNDGKGIRDAIQASGMEDSVINLAIRAALSKVNLLPRPSLFIIDEAFSTLDDENTENVKALLVSLKEYYQNIILITHKEDMKDLPEYHIYLEKVNNVTKILN